MRKSLSSLIGFAAAAAFGVIVLNRTLVPAGFCEGIREYDGLAYPVFIDAHALTDQDVAVAAQDPILREQLRRTRAGDWKKSVRNGQMQLCGKASF